MRRKSLSRDTTVLRASELQFQAKLRGRSLLHSREPATTLGRNAHGPRLVLHNGQAKKDCPPLCSANLARSVEPEPGRKTGAARMLPLLSRRVPKYLCYLRRGAWKQQAMHPALTRESNHPGAPYMIVHSKPRRL